MPHPSSPPSSDLIAERSARSSARAAVGENPVGRIIAARPYADLIADAHLYPHPHSRTSSLANTEGEGVLAASAGVEDPEKGAE
jgi:hypothetical protein